MLLQSEKSTRHKGKIFINNFSWTFKMPLPPLLIPLIYSIINFIYVSQGYALMSWEGKRNVDMQKLKMKTRIIFYYSSHKSLQIKKLLELPLLFFCALLNIERRKEFNDVQKMKASFHSIQFTFLYVLWYSYI